MWSTKQVQIPSRERMHRMDSERCGMHGMTATSVHVSGLGIQVGWGRGGGGGGSSSQCHWGNHC